MKYPVHKLEYSYTIKSTEFGDVTITFRVLSKKELLNIENKYYDKNSPTNHLYTYHIVKTSLLTPGIIDTLSDDQISELFYIIMEKSKVSQDIIGKLKASFDISNDKKLSADTWKCEVCKIRGLQASRNCPYLEDKSNNDITFRIMVNGHMYSDCPISHIDNELLQAGYDCYFMYNKGILPEKGGMYDQTEFFNVVALSMYSWIKNLQNEAIKDDKT